MLRDKTFYYRYSKVDLNKPSDFCLQALCNSNHLDLGLGYFSSASINVLANGFAHFIVNGGTMNLYINQYVSEEDFNLLSNNIADEFENSIIESFQKLKETFSKRDEHFFRCISYLIQKEKINIKIVVLDNGCVPHEKYGIFTDELGDKIYFNGSMNMTASAILGNLETIECTCSWKGNDSLEKVDDFESHFNRVWSGKCDGVKVFNAQKFCSEILKTYPNQDPENLVEQEKLFISQSLTAEKKENIESPHFPEKYKSGAFPYQEEAYKKWIDNGKMGIFAMATGTGKTVTALNCCLHEFSEDNFYHLLILVPTLDLVEQWEEELKNFNFKKIFKVSSLFPSWRKNIYDLSLKLKRGKLVNFAIVSTYDSFVIKDFQMILPSLSEKMILIADEAHNIGGNNVKSCFRTMSIPRRIALSATPERIYDDEGTTEICSFFNDSYPYVYSFPMSRAIEEGRLCHYYYYPKVAYLSEDEMEKYTFITKKLMALYDSDKGKFKNKLEAEKLLMNRKRIIHKAEDKLRVYGEILKNIGEDKLKYTFVYAPEGKYEKLDIDNEIQLTETDDIRFIKKLLDQTKKIFPSKRCNTFTGNDDKSKRSALLKAFGDGKLDVLFAMKCLDEGVNIPRAEYGIFTSSTGNPREYIQRRGRLLRTHKEKKYSYIYDIIVIPSVIGRVDNTSQMERNIVKHELQRVAYFASLALNFHTNDGAFEVLNDIAHHFGIQWNDLLDNVKQ